MINPITGRVDNAKPRRVLLKISGEALKGVSDNQECYDFAVVDRIAREVVDAYSQGVQVVLVPGGGNIFRGVFGERAGMPRAEADITGMLATLMNAKVLASFIKKHLPNRQNVDSVVRVMTALKMDEAAEPYIISKAKHHLDENRIIIIGCGSGIPLCTTDHAAAQHGRELDVSLVLKATDVAGIYSEDPKLNNEATCFERLTFTECIVNRYPVMDTSAFIHCQDGKLPIRVFTLEVVGNITRAIMGDDIGTLVTNDI